MNILDRLFRKADIECPRCLGKGHVDNNDIKRLKKELYWSPGECAFCEGKGKVTNKMISSISPDNSYLTMDITKDERNRLIRGDKHTLDRAKYFEDEIDYCILQIEYLHFNGKMNADKILEYFFLPTPIEKVPEKDKNEFAEYINKVIELKKSER